MTPEQIAERDAAALAASQERRASEYNLAQRITDEDQILRAISDADDTVRRTLSGRYSGTPVLAVPAAPAAPATTTPAAPAAPASPVPAAPAAPGAPPTAPTPVVADPPADDDTTTNRTTRVREAVHHNPWLAVLAFFVFIVVAIVTSQVMTAISDGASGDGGFASDGWLNILVSCVVAGGIALFFYDKMDEDN